MDQVGKEKNMNYGSAFDEKRGWGKTEGKNMDQNFIKMWVKKKIWTMDQLSMKKVGEEDGRKKYGSEFHKNVSKKNYITKFWTVDQVGKKKIWTMDQLSMKKVGEERRKEKIWIRIS